MGARKLRPALVPARTEPQIDCLSCALRAHRTFIRLILLSICARESAFGATPSRPSTPRYPACAPRLSALSPAEVHRVTSFRSAIDDDRKEAALALGAIAPVKDWDVAGDVGAARGQEQAVFGRLAVDSCAPRRANLPFSLGRPSAYG